MGSENKVAAVEASESFSEEIDIAGLPFGMQADLGLVDEDKAVVADCRRQTEKARDDAQLAGACVAEIKDRSVFLPLNLDGGHLHDPEAAQLLHVPEKNVVVRPAQKVGLENKGL